MYQHRVVLVLLATCPSYCTGKNEAFYGFFQGCWHITSCRLGVIFLVLRRHKSFIVTDFANNGKNGLVVVFSIIGCTEHTLWADIIGRSWQVDDKILREQVIILKWYKYIRKRRGCIADITHLLELAEYLAYAIIDGRRITVLLCIDTGIIRLVVYDKEGLCRAFLFRCYL
jgi:hypothetical protein